MAFVKNWLHIVWSTKNRVPFLATNIRQQVFKHIHENALAKDIYIDIINGGIEHAHCLLSLNADVSLSKTMMLIKGESSFWINKQGICTGHFEWQDDYFGVSVSESQLEPVRNYIRNQEEHHRKKTFEEEYDEFMRKYQFGKQRQG